MNNIDGMPGEDNSTRRKQMPRADFYKCLHAVWEQITAFELAIYDFNVNWAESLPITAPNTLKKLAEDLLNAACELSSIACGLEAENKAEEQRMQAVGAALAKGFAAVERDTLTRRFAEIVKEQKPRT
jgi:hypothetical protein